MVQQGLGFAVFLWLKRKTVKSETTMMKTRQHMDSIKQLITYVSFHMQWKKNMIFTRVCLLQLIPSVKRPFLLLTQVWSLLQQPVRDPALTDTYVEREIAVASNEVVGKLRRVLLVLGYWFFILFFIRKLQLKQLLYWASW